MPKYDYDLEAEVVTWMEETTGVIHAHCLGDITRLPEQVWSATTAGMEVDMDEGDLMDFLKTGVYLCTLLNSLQPRTVKKISPKKIAFFQVKSSL